MVLTGKDQPHEKASSIARKRRIQQQRRALNILLLLVLLGFFVLGFKRVTTYETDITRSTFTIPGSIPVPVLEMKPAKGDTKTVAIVAHGFAGNKDLMTSFGVELAHADVTTYLLDFPGHGESPVTLTQSSPGIPSNTNNIKAISEVVDYARTHNNATRHPGIVLLGHSMGSVAVGDYAITHAADNDILATILVSPVGQEQPTSEYPRNLLILVGAHDIEWAIADSQRLMKLACGSAQQQSVPQDCGNPAQGTGRRLISIAGHNHLSILNSTTAHQETLNWLHHTTTQVKATDIHASMRLFWLLLGIAGIILALFPLEAILIEIFEISPVARMVRGLDVILAMISLVIGISAAIAIQYFWQPFGFLHIMIVDYVSGYFFLTALVMGLCLFLLKRYLPLPSFSHVTKQLILAASLSIFLYFTLGELSTFAWERIMFSLPRFWRFAIIFIALLPIFLLDEGISRGYQTRGTFRGILASLSFKALLLAGLIIAVVITPGIGFLSIVLPLLAILLILLTGYCTQLYCSGRASLTGAILSAFLIAWCMAACLPLS